MLKTTVIAWIHPHDGDDYQVELHWDCLVADADISREIVNQGSVCGHDYRRI